MLRICHLRFLELEEAFENQRPRNLGYSDLLPIQWKLRLEGFKGLVMINVAEYKNLTEHQQAAPESIGVTRACRRAASVGPDQLPMS